MMNYKIIVNDDDVTRRNLFRAVYDPRHEGSSRRVPTIGADDVVARATPRSRRAQSLSQIWLGDGGESARYEKRDGSDLGP